MESGKCWLVSYHNSSQKDRYLYASSHILQIRHFVGLLSRPARRKTGGASRSSSSGGRMEPGSGVGATGGTSSGDSGMDVTTGLATLDSVVAFRRGMGTGTETGGSKLGDAVGAMKQAILACSWSTWRHTSWPMAGCTMYDTGPVCWPIVSGVQVAWFPW